MIAGSSSTHTLDAILSTDELDRRVSRPSDFEAENRALIALAKHLANSPKTILQKLVEVAIETLNAGSAGVSVISNETGDFYWPAIAGQWKGNIGGGTPRGFGPCGTVLDRDCAQLFTRPERHFPYLAAASPGIEEGLLCPFYIDGKAVGTVWLIAHDRERSFDREDLRVLNNLGEFAAAAYQTLEAIRAQEAKSEILATREAFLQCIVSASADCLKIVNVSGKLEWMSAGSLSVMEIDRLSDVAGADWPSFWKKELTAEARKSLEVASGGGIGRFRGFCPTYKGTPRWWDVVVTPILNADGKVERLLATSRDITQQHLAQEALTQARDEALRASATKDRFLAGLSHELRTPLNPILLLASGAAQNMSLPADVRADFEMIRKNIELETRLIEDLLDLTQASKGKMSLKTTRVDLTEVIGDALANLQAEIDGKDIQLRKLLPPAIPSFWGDPDRLQQVFWNLLRNAVKFTPHGGTVAIDARILTAENRIEVGIGDTGMGMTPEEMERLFVPFSQGIHADGPTGSVQFGGLGLGLSISKHIMELHAGTLTASSGGPGKGSKFTVGFMLPANGAFPKEVPLAERPGAANVRPLRIMLVEDHEPTRHTMKRLLEARGHRVEVAASGLELSKRQGWTADLVLCDIGLPDISGYELFKEVRLTKPQMRGFALSGYGTEEDIEQAKSAGFVEHLVKPVAISVLERALARHF